MEPAEVTVIVKSCQGLQGKKKDRHKYSVIFGMGNNKFRTQTVIQENGCPVWNEESVVAVDKLKPLKFKVTEKNDILGCVKVPIDEISASRTFTSHTCDLRPHRKCPKPKGQLTFECWVSKHREQTQAKIRGSTESLNKIKSSPFTKLKTRLSHSPMMGKRLGSKGSTLQPNRGTQSMYDLSTNQKDKQFTLERDVSFGSVYDDDSDDDQFLRNSPSMMSLNSQVIDEVEEGIPGGAVPYQDPTATPSPVLQARSKTAVTPVSQAAVTPPVTPLMTRGEPAEVQKSVPSPAMFHAEKDPTLATPKVNTASKAEDMGSSMKSSPSTPAIVVTKDEDVSHDKHSKSANVNPLPAKIAAVRPMQSGGSMTNLNTLGKTETMNNVLSTEPQGKPEVTGLSPREGPIEGGTRLTIRGINLGQNHEDVIGLFVCGANCLATMEYESTTKLTCVTKAWKPCTGHIVIETQSGGKGTSLVEFTFVAPKLDLSDIDTESSSEQQKTAVKSARLSRNSDTLVPEGKPAVKPVNQDRQEDVEQSPVHPPKKAPSLLSLLTGMDKKSDHEGGKDSGTPHRSKKELAAELFKMESENKRLQEENSSLQDENEHLRSYIVTLLQRVITTCPDVLCVDSSQIPQRP